MLVIKISCQGTGTGISLNFHETYQEVDLTVIPYVTDLCTIKREELKCGFERSITIVAQNVLVPLPAMKFPPLLVW